MRFLNLQFVTCPSWFRYVYSPNRRQGSRPPWRDRPLWYGSSDWSLLFVARMIQTWKGNQKGLTHFTELFLPNPSIKSISFLQRNGEKPQCFRISDFFHMEIWSQEKQNPLLSRTSASYLALRGTAYDMILLDDQQREPPHQPPVLGRASPPKYTLSKDTGCLLLICSCKGIF